MRYIRAANTPPPYNEPRIDFRPRSPICMF